MMYLVSADKGAGSTVISTQASVVDSEFPLVEPVDRELPVGIPSDVALISIVNVPGEPVREIFSLTDVIVCAVDGVNDWANQVGP
jgi:hypothetical protein